MGNEQLGFRLLITPGLRFQALEVIVKCFLAVQQLSPGHRFLGIRSGSSQDGDEVALHTGLDC